jgi:hypothetical protein
MIQGYIILLRGEFAIKTLNDEASLAAPADVRGGRRALEEFFEGF